MAYSLEVLQMCSQWSNEDLHRPDSEWRLNKMHFIAVLISSLSARAARSLTGLVCQTQRTGKRITIYWLHIDFVWLHRALFFGFNEFVACREFCLEQLLLWVTVKKWAHASVRLGPGTLGNLHVQLPRRFCEHFLSSWTQTNPSSKQELATSIFNCLASAWVTALPNKWSSARLSLPCHLWRWQTKKSVYSRVEMCAPCKTN